MAEFKGIVHINYVDLVGIGSGPNQVYIEEGRGRTSLETGLMPDFEVKVRQLNSLIFSKIPLSLGADAKGNTKYEPMSERDLKCRYDQHRFVEEDGGGRHLSVYIGPTSWQECQQDYNRSEVEARQLEQLGVGKMRTKGTGIYEWAKRRYFSCGLGATVLTLTREGDIVVGIRQSDSYDGAIHGAAGWMQFDPDLNIVHPENDARRELEEELGLYSSNIFGLDLIGLVSEPKTLETDFVYVAQTIIGREYFKSGEWKNAVDAKEHTDLVLLSNPDEIGQLLGEGRVPGLDEKRYDVLVPTHYGLEQVAKHWERFHRQGGFSDNG